MWYVDGVKGFYDGYYKSLYKRNMDSDMKKCLNEQTIQNMIKFGTILEHPMSIFSNIQEDFNLFAEGSEIMTDLAECNFMGSFIDVKEFCSENADKCAFGSLAENLSKNMFVLIGKVTSLAEILKEFPAQSGDDFAEQMYQIGDNFGTLIRSVYDFKTAEEISEPVQHHTYSHHTNF